jgi:hypothetical protein
MIFSFLLAGAMGKTRWKLVGTWKGSYGEAHWYFNGKKSRVLVWPKAGGTNDDLTKLILLVAAVAGEPHPEKWTRSPEVVVFKIKHGPVLK